MIGNHVHVIVDRPIGSYHPKFKGSVYHVNYGVVLNIDGDPEKHMGAYILGVDKPIESFDGVVIAIIHRLDDVEDKLVVAKEGASYSKIEIGMLTHSQEKFFKTKIVTDEESH